MASASPPRVRLHELTFEPYLTQQSIRGRVDELGEELHHRLADGGKPVFLVMLKGAFVFAADLIRAAKLDGEVEFVRTKSYRGTDTSGDVQVLLPPDPALVKDHDVILIEDIVDSGHTMQAFLPKLRALGPRSVTLVTLLHKPEAAEVNIEIDMVGFIIPPKFVVGYGLDYDGLGRHLPGLYRLTEDF